MDWLYQALEIATLVLVVKEYMVWQDYPEQSVPVPLRECYFFKTLLNTLKLTKTLTDSNF